MLQVKRLLLLCTLLLLGFALSSCDLLRFEGRWVWGLPPDVQEGWRLSRIETDYHGNGVINAVSDYEYDSEGLLREVITSGDRVPVKGKSFEFTFKDDDQLERVEVDYENFKGKIYRYFCNVDPSGYGTPVPAIEGHQDTQSRIESIGGYLAEYVYSNSGDNSGQLINVIQYKESKEPSDEDVTFDGESWRKLSGFIHTYDGEGRLVQVEQDNKTRSLWQEWIFEYDDKGLLERQRWFFYKDDEFFRENIFHYYWEQESEISPRARQTYETLHPVLMAL
jgi:hypothetical protein